MLLAKRVRSGHLLLLRERGWGWRFGGRELALLVFLLMSAGLGLRRCACRWTRPVGGGQWGHCLRDPSGSSLVCTNMCN